MSVALISGRLKRCRGACFVLVLSLLTIDYLLLTASVHGFDRTNVPLKNWGGFGVQRSWVYDALEKIVLAGLTDEVVLNTRPLTRVEAARIVGQAVRRLRWDQYGDFNHRGYLEELLYRLVEEFAPELAEMGIKTSLNRDAEPSFFQVKPVDHIQVGAGFSTRSQSVVNRFGERVAKGGTPSFTLDGRIQVGDFLSFYYQPEFSRNRDSVRGRLLHGYSKLTFWDTELEVGRDSLWWGPGFRGSMLFSTNSLPLEQVRLSSAEPFRLPWLLSYLGPVKATFMVARLEEDRDVPRAKVLGWRLNAAPSRYLEVGFNRVFQFGGRGRRALKPGQFLRLLVDAGSDDANSPLNVNNVMSFDVTVRVPEIERYILIARDAAFYLDFGWDDTLFGLIVPDSPGGIAGAYLTGFLGDPKLDLRIEYAQSSEIMFTHSTYTSGFTHRGSVLSHFIGTKGNEIYARLSRWMSPDLLLGAQVSQAEIGSPLSTLLPREKRNVFGFDVSYRLSDHSSIFLGYDFARVKDRGFVAGKSGSDSLFRIEFTRRFGW